MIGKEGKACGTPGRSTREALPLGKRRSKRTTQETAWLQEEAARAKCKIPQTKRELQIGEHTMPPALTEKAIHIFFRGPALHSMTEEGTLHL